VQEIKAGQEVEVLMYYDIEDVLMTEADLGTMPIVCIPTVEHI
jgi:hypothetical protein